MEQVGQNTHLVAHTQYLYTVLVVILDYAVPIISENRQQVLSSVTTYLLQNNRYIISEPSLLMSEFPHLLYNLPYQVRTFLRPLVILYIRRLIPPLVSPLSPPPPFRKSGYPSIHLWHSSCTILRFIPKLVNR